MQIELENVIGMNECLRDLHNSQHHTETEFNNSFIIRPNYF